MDYQVILSDSFISDLKEIVDYLTDKASPEIASRIGNDLIDRALEIGLNPFTGRPVKQRAGVRKALWHAYLIYYDVDETRHVVKVLRAWHGARDPKTLRL